MSKNAVEPIRNKNHIIAVEKFLEKKNYRNMMIWVFGINTGLRISDILNLNVGDVKNKSFVKLKEKKNRKIENISS